MEIAIALDTYDDLFSDFDIRGYGERALSKDFLDELRVRLRRMRPEGDLAIVFLIPATQRNKADEELIIKRLGSFYADRCESCRREGVKALQRSLVFVATGIILSIAASFAVGYLHLNPLFSDFVLIPSWFFVWSGIENFLKSREEIGRKKRYYGALAASTTIFRLMDGCR
jgi:hypothetical protein